MIKLNPGSIVQLGIKRKGEITAYVLGVSFVRTVNGDNRFLLDCSDIWGYLETSVDLPDIEYIVEMPMTTEIKNRLLSKWGEEICKARGIISKRKKK